MDLSWEIANYLADNGYGTLGTNIFAGQIPADTNGIYIVRAAGSLNNYIPIEETVLDIYCKSESANDSITTIESIKRFMHRMIDTETDNSKIYSILAIGDVEDVGRDLEYAKIFKITVSILCRDKALIS